MKRKPIIIIVLLIALSLILLIFLSGARHKISEETQTTTRSLQVNGLERAYRIHIPPSLPENINPALVFVLHGGGGTGEGMESRITLGGFDALADQHHFIVVYPDGIEKNWNDGRKNVADTAHQQNIDDVGFLSALIDNLTIEFHIDPKRVYATGISNGAMMSYRLAFDIPEKIAAIAPVAGSIPTDLLEQGRLNNFNVPISICAISGTDDPLVPWLGGQVGIAENRGSVISVNDSVMYWVTHNNCSQTPNSVELSDIDSKDGTRVNQETWGNGANDTEVILYTVISGGHTWPDGYQYLPQLVIGRTTHDINANNLIWDFFSTHPKN